MTDMIDASPTWFQRPSPTSAEALLELESACAWIQSVRRLKAEDAIGDADRRLREAVDAARDAGIAWGVIGDRLGIARGNAYQKYRKRHVA